MFDRGIFQMVTVLTQGACDSENRATLRRSNRMALAWIGFVLAGMVFIQDRNAVVGQEGFAPRLLRSSSVQLSEDESHLLVANHGDRFDHADQKASLSIVQLNHDSENQIHRGRLIATVPLGKDLADLIRIPKTNVCLAADFEAHRVIGFEYRPDNESERIKVLWTINVARNPVKLAVRQCEQGIQVATSGLWSRQIDIHLIEDPAEQPEKQRTMDLNFCPGSLAWVDSHQLLVADAFGDQMVLLDRRSAEVKTLNDFANHQTGGMILDSSSKSDAGSILISQQRLKSVARSTRNDVHWGMMIRDLVRRVPVQAILNRAEQNSSPNIVSPNDVSPKDVSLSDESRKFPVGRTGAAKADLGSLQTIGAGKWAVAVQGANEIALIDPASSSRPDFIAVGQRPIAMAADELNQTLFVVHGLDNSLSIVDLKNKRVAQTISLGKMPELTSVQRGERLFYNASLSHDGWMSCHSCHVEGHSNGLLNDNKSDDSFGTPKRVISLLGHADTAPLGWTGANPDYETQIRKTIKVTMQGHKELTEGEMKDLIAFVRSLPAPPSVMESRAEREGVLDAKLKEQIAAGATLFERQGCMDCHAQPRFTTARTVEIGVEDESGRTQLNPPSLIGLSQRNRFFHDNRVEKLPEVFEQPGHQIKGNLSDDQMSALLAFLRSL